MYLPYIMKTKKYYLDNSVESLLRKERQKYNSSKSSWLDFIATSAICSMAVVMLVYIGKLFMYLPEALNSFK